MTTATQRLPKHLQPMPAWKAWIAALLGYVSAMFAIGFFCYKVVLFCVLMFPLSIIFWGYIILPFVWIITKITFTKSDRVKFAREFWRW